MIAMFVEVLPPFGGETAEELCAIANDDIMSLNGKQTIYQMIRLTRSQSANAAECRTSRSGTSTNTYVVWTSASAIGSTDCEMVPFPAMISWFTALGLCSNASAAGMTLFLASGTDEVFVKREAKLLDVDRYFGERIYGTVDAYQTFSKKMVIERDILREHAIPGEQLLAFGDGFVENSEHKRCRRRGGGGGQAMKPPTAPAALTRGNVNA